MATGGEGARLRVVEKTGKGAQLTKVSGMRADMLVARFADASAAPAGKVKSGLGPPLVGVDGKGKTYLEQLVTDAKGAVVSKQTGTGDALKVDFRTGDDGKTEIQRAEQRGSVSLEREATPVAGKATADTPAKPPVPLIQHAKADDAVFVEDTDETTLTGNVALQDAQSAMFADKVVSDRTSGDSTAEGNVKVSYLQAGSKDEPVHVLATRSVSHKASGVTEFFAGPGGKVRMWQGGSQVEAPVIDFDQTNKTLLWRRMFRAAMARW